MKVSPGDALATINDGYVSDTRAKVGDLRGLHSSLEAAVGEATLVARAPDIDAAIVDEGGSFRVVTLPEIGANEVRGASPLLVGIVAGRGQSAGIRRTADKSSRMDAAERLALAAGIPAGTALRLSSGGLDPNLARQILDDIARNSSTPLQSFPARATLSQLCRDAVGSATTLSPTQLCAELERYAGLVVVRPDGYVARATTGQPLMFAGEPRVSWDGIRAGGDFRVGDFYANRAGVLYEAGPDLAPTGEPIRELGLERELLMRVVDGAALGMFDTLRGMFNILAHPIRTAEGLASLPWAIGPLIQSSPAYWQRFQAMPAGDQVEAVSRIASQLLATGTAGAATATRLAKLGAATEIGASIEIPTMSLSVNGELAFATVTIDATTDLAMVGYGAGATFVVASVMPDAQEIADRSTDYWPEQYAEKGWDPIRERTFEGSPKHHAQSRGGAARPPTNAQATLEESVAIKPTSPRRVGFDPETGEFAVFDETYKHSETFHGHVRTWDELEQEMQAALIKAGKVDSKGRPLNR